MESHNASRRPQYGNNNYNRSTGELRQDGNPQDLTNVSDRDYPDSRHTQGKMRYCYLFICSKGIACGSFGKRSAEKFTIKHSRAALINNLSFVL